MENVLINKIQSTALTRTEQKIADYFLKNLEQVGKLSTSELAKKIGVSDASIIRFSRAIGYDGFLDLKNDIYYDLVSRAVNASSKRSLIERFESNQNENAWKDQPQQYIDIMQHNIEQSFQQNPPESYAKIVDLLLSANGKYISGLRGCKGISSQFARLLQFATDHVVDVTTSDSDAVGTLLDIGKNDVFLMFVLSRYYRGDMVLINTAHKQGAKICVITDSMLAPMIPYADVTLIAKTSHLSFFHSTIGMNMISEYIITLLTYRDWDRAKTRINSRDLYVEEELI